MAWVYILECSDGSYYTGSTTNLELRLQQHHSGLGANFTRKKKPFDVVYVEECTSITDTFAREKQIQGWSRAKKRALIDGRLGDLSELSRSRR